MNEGHGSGTVGGAIRFVRALVAGAILGAVILAFGLIGITAAVVVGLVAIGAIVLSLVFLVPMAALKGNRVVEGDVVVERDGKVVHARHFGTTSSRTIEH